jgi:cysteinyl-tRNA synthetase
MALRFLNTLTRDLQEFVPLDPERRRVGMYCCGPTVHDFAHIGNFRTFVFADVVRRYLEFSGYVVDHVMNITDVEDKIIQRVAQRQVALRDYTAEYEEAFFADLDALGCRRPHHTPRATQHMPEIVALIQRLEERHLAYRAADGSVYFSIEKYRASGRHYGQLLRLNLDQLRPGDRVRHDEYEKESVADFALWKARVPEDGEVFWPSPWGEGRPGWHIECSAMSMGLLGPSFDLHLGGEDLIFPHHEDEIAQSEGAGLQPADRRFVQCWLHGAHLLVDGRKMSKSLGNYYTFRDLVQRGYAGREIRYLLLTAHYRESFNFTLEGLLGARSALARLDECVGRLRELASPKTVPPQRALSDAFSAAMDEDLNVSAGWACVFEWVRETNRRLAAGELQADEAAAALGDWERVDGVLGVGARAEAEAPPAVLQLLEQRQAARRARDFSRADALRDELKALGWLIDDTPKGPRLKRR